MSDLDTRIRDLMTVATAVAPEPPPLPSTSMPRVRRRRGFALTAALAAVAALVAAVIALTSADHTSHRLTVSPPTVPSPTSTFVPTDPTAALRQFVSASGEANSGVVQTSSLPIAAVSFNSTQADGGAYPVVDILAFQHGAWSAIAKVTLDIGGVVQPEAPGPTPITVVHFTGARDFAVMVSYNDGPAVAVISDVGGTWHALRFRGGPTPNGDEVINPTLGGTGITARYNTCSPSCAAGHYRTVTYRYSTATGDMTAV